MGVGLLYFQLTFRKWPLVGKHRHGSLYRYTKVYQRGRSSIQAACVPNHLPDFIHLNKRIIHSAKIFTENLDFLLAAITSRFRAETTNALY